ncbi:MAG: hypothetical protein ACJ8EA_17730 [Xanthobacteraceae bacterium]
MGVPHDLHMRPRKDEGIVGTLRNLKKFIDSVDELKSIELDFIKGAQDVRQLLQDLYRTPGRPRNSDSGGNATDLGSEKLPREGTQRPQPHVGGGFKNPSLKFRLKDAKILPDFRTLTLFGEAKATYEIATEYPAKFDIPTEIALKITSTSISPSQIGVVGTATAYKVFRGDFKVQLHYDVRQLLTTTVRFAKNRNLTRGEVEQMLQSVSFDASAVVKAGFLPLSYLKLSASSLLPFRRPLIGATDELLPVQLSTLPDREMFVGGVQVVPKGVFFDVPVPALGLHYSKYGRTQGLSGTLAGLAKPDLNKLGQVQTFGYLDMRYAKRLSNAIDLDVGVTYTYSPGSEPGGPESLQLQYLHARSKSWLPSSRDNVSPDANRSGHNFMFTIRGTFDAF